MSHVVLLGDSIFDNAAYVPDRPPVIEQVRRGLPLGWKATLVAVDGHMVEDISTQLGRVPGTATHLILNVGGNDALSASSLLREPVATVGDALTTIAEAISEFRTAYIEMLRLVLNLGKPTCVCTIYDAVPVISGAERAALAGFNDVISRAAVTAGVPVVELRVVCNSADDYSPLSPIEPSVTGGAKIADAICRMLAAHDFTTRRTAVWV
ncbi:lipase : GDSL-lilke lipase/acylhydrolase family protein OS=Cyanothece sp. (strain PCC 7425 / ATCC 29141) GN=Cyan7425_1989 PE=4 SV=1: Lipase_GDSL_2 [Gemmataceae bacterium]|jgi:lysophospholipase L1-like esterase|nr:lipase : GDSL-lilke lipase/acylhydrolase family protein OS=Cyanothece sp. (strain PCC 7425 / ATCC 29141) GN=Cyan7425_1989 PE=4 SV=1: Lipase_GDSL_2 [Gemmataceae bacterium]VTU00457.1 lipase : GDSL-lilke lipase/acylhydrolase family protein OS=Cyanothece sp. (strain PCC 7425 / ATCC 29141) GN=Cyan7425_1989 PE=4 SV=1: Lipase_GDSL_2 [Gemmataceae bacterium]